MKRILLLGDSITDMGRSQLSEDNASAYGNGYPFFVEGELGTTNAGEYEVFNRGVGGNRIVDLYARIKCDCWNFQPDYVSILIGVNDVWHGLWNNGVEIARFEKIYRMLIQDTLDILPNVKIMLLAPFVLKGTATTENWKYFLQVKEYAKVVENLAKEFNLTFVPLQDKLDEYCNKFGVNKFFPDGVHPTVAGAKLIANEWFKGFEKISNRRIK